MTASALDLFTLFTELSLLGFGGINAVLPEMHRQIVEVNHWMTAETFSTLYAIAQAAPGPNVMVATLIGWHLAGASGAVAATLGVFVAPSLLTAAAMAVLGRFTHAPVIQRLKAGLVPVTVGLVIASGVALTQAADGMAWAALAITAGAAVAMLSGRGHPLVILAMGALLGVVLL